MRYKWVKTQSLIDEANRRRLPIPTTKDDEEKRQILIELLKKSDKNNVVISKCLDERDRRTNLL
jgi:hypothetical protein